MERTTWTDHRLDDFARHVDARFDQVDQRFDRLELDIRDLRTEVHGEFGAMRTTLVRVGGGLMVGLVGVIATLLTHGA